MKATAHERNSHPVTNLSNAKGNVRFNTARNWRKKNWAAWSKKKNPVKKNFG